MKFIFFASLLFLLLPAQEVTCENKYTIQYLKFDPDTVNFFMNPGFEDWTEGQPDYWNQVADTIGVINNNVTTVMESLLKTEGSYSAIVSSIQPFGGISQPINENMPSSWNIYPLSGRAALHLAKENGTSSHFSIHELVQDDFELTDLNAYSSAIRNAHALRIDNGDYIEIFSASASCEATYHGALYLKRNGCDPQVFLDYPGHKTWAWPGVIDMGSKYVFVTMRYDSTGKQKLFATDISRDFYFATNDRLIFEIDSTNVQCYNMLRLKNNQILLPIVYAESKQASSGPWYLDILTTYDFETINRLNQPITYPTKGLMEAQPVLLSDNNVAILCRTNKKYLAKSIYDPVNQILHPAVATEIAQPEAGCFAKNLSDKSILLSWLSSTRLRKVLVMALSTDDMTTWNSYHVIMTSSAMGHDMSSSFPYIHQPYIYEDTDGSITCYFEEVSSTTDINLYKTKSDYFRTNNVANNLNEWQEITLDWPYSASSIQLLNAFSSYGLACFDQPGITDIVTLPVGTNIYPNPVVDILHISTDYPVTAIELADLNGRIIKQIEVDKISSENSIPMQDLAPGMYIVKLARGEVVDIIKVIKTR